MSRKGKQKGFLGITSRAIMIGVAVLLFLSCMSVLVSPAHFWLLSCLGLLFIPLFLVNLFLVIWAAKRRSKAIFIPLVALIPSFLFIGEFVQIPFSRNSTDEEPSFKIVSYNVGRFSQYRGRGISSSKECMDSVFSYLKAQNPDIICLQEFSVGDKADVERILKKNFPGYYNAYYAYFGRNSLYGNVTLSRFPIEGKDEIRFDKSSNVAIYTDILINSRIIRVYNCHLQSYNISLGRVIKSLGRDKELIRDTEEKMKISSEKRPDQVARILSSVKESKYETILCGDFNDTPVSYTYYKFRKGHEDSFIDAGRGFGATYHLLWPLLRIDYVLYPKSLMAVSHKTFHEKYSDHYPVTVQFK